MTTYIIRRFIQGLIVLVLATFVIYSILVITPGGPADQIAEMKATSSSNKRVNVMKLMGDRVGNTLALTMTALGLSILVAVPIGIISAIRQYSRLDYAVTGFSFVGLSMPTFWLGLMLVIFLAVIPKQIHDSG